jgi:hypothetical protein
VDNGTSIKIIAYRDKKRGNSLFSIKAQIIDSFTDLSTTYNGSGWSIPDHSPSQLCEQQPDFEPSASEFLRLHIPDHQNISNSRLSTALARIIVRYTSGDNKQHFSTLNNHELRINLIAISDRSIFLAQFPPMFSFSHN